LSYSAPSRETSCVIFVVFVLSLDLSNLNIDFLAAERYRVDEIGVD
jgi:hypothetical protein